MEKRKALFNVFLLLILLLVIIGVFLSCSSKKMTDKDSQIKSENVSSKKQYVCSMDPQVIKNLPGNCPICGMSLIEKVIDKNPADTLLNGIVLPVNESVISNMTTVNPVNDDVSLNINASGIINFDTRNIHIISARFGGVIEKSFVKSPFQRIRKGQKIYVIFCPNIYTEHWNYIKLVQTYPTQDNLTIEAREWLKFLGLTTSQIESLKRSPKPDYHLAVYSTADGYAVPVDFDSEKYFSSGNIETNNQQTNQNAGKSVGLNEGMTIETGNSLFKILDVKLLRADIKVKTQEIGFLHRGQRVVISVNGSTGKKYESTISQIEPLNGGVFQLVKVYFKDKDGILIPGRQIQAKIITGKHNSIWLPETTVLNMGQHKTVFVKCKDKFLATIIKTGLHNGNRIEILSGLDHDSKVALNASLLIDSDGLINEIK